jgi:hypothetical protein
LTTIAEPKARPDYIHEFEVTKYSLYAAASIGYTAEKIETELMKYCKNESIPECVSRFIRDHCSSYGKVKLVLKATRFFIETKDPSIMKKIKEIPVVQESVKEIEKIIRLNENKNSKHHGSTDLKRNRVGQAEMAEIVESQKKRQKLNEGPTTTVETTLKSKKES